jgi:hypothetical protein
VKEGATVRVCVRGLPPALLLMRSADTCSRRNSHHGALGHVRVTVVCVWARARVLPWSVQEEYNARLLLSEGRIRFLEKRIAVMEDEQRAGTRSNSRGAAPLPNARKTPGEAGRAFGAGGGVAARGGEMVADSGVTNECGDVEGGSYTAGGGGRIPAADTANHLGSASTAGAG